MNPNGLYTIFFKCFRAKPFFNPFNSAVLNSFLKISAKVQKEKESIEEDYRRPSWLILSDTIKQNTNLMLLGTIK